MPDRYSGYQAFDPESFSRKKQEQQEKSNKEHRFDSNRRMYFDVSDVMRLLDEMPVPDEHAGDSFSSDLLLAATNPNISSSSPELSAWIGSDENKDIVANIAQESDDFFWDPALREIHLSDEMKNRLREIDNQPKNLKVKVEYLDGREGDDISNRRVQIDLSEFRKQNPGLIDGSGRSEDVFSTPDNPQELKADKNPFDERAHIDISNFQKWMGDEKNQIDISDSYGFSGAGNTFTAEKWQGIETGLAYQGRNYLSASDKLTSRFVDGGSSATFDLETNEHSAGRELIVVDPENDPKLSEMIQEAKDIVNECLECTTHQLVQKVAEYAYEKVAQVDNREVLQRSNKLPEGEEVYLGDIVGQGAAVCRHRSFLFKSMMDAMPQSFQEKVQTAVIRGGVKNPLSGKYGAHAWNTVRIGGHIYEVDLMNPASYFKNEQKDDELFPFPEITHGASFDYYYFHDKKSGPDTVYRGGEPQKGEWRPVGQFLGHPDAARDFKSYEIQEAYSERIIMSQETEIAKIEGLSTAGSTKEYAVALECIHSLSAELVDLTEDDFINRTHEMIKNHSMITGLPMEQLKESFTQSIASKALRLFREMKDNDWQFVVNAKIQGGKIKAQDIDSYRKLRAMKEFRNQNEVNMYVLLADLDFAT